MQAVLLHSRKMVRCRPDHSPNQIGFRRGERVVEGDMKSPVVRQGRLCAFCGEKPKNKTKEHVLPRWLIRAAGKEGESVWLGVNRYTGREYQFPFEQLTLPACDVCNNFYAQLEGKAQPVLEKLFAEQRITTGDLVVLLDWFDKVRLGLWLWHLAMNGKPIARRFHITQRLGRKDRLLFLAYFEGQPRGMSLFGINNLAFELSPSCFGLTVKNIAFINASFDHLLSQQLGFPYIDHWRLQGEGEPELGNLRPATGKISAEFLPNRFKFPGFLCGQCMFHHEWETVETRSLYQNPLLKDVMLPDAKESHVMLRSEGAISPLHCGSEIHPSAMAGVKAKTLKTWVPLEVTRLQKDIQNNTPDYRWVESRRREMIDNRLREAGLELDMQTEVFTRAHVQGGGFII
jgi:hypothetical protein